MRNCEPTPRGTERGGAGNPPLQVRAPHFYPTPVNTHARDAHRRRSPTLIAPGRPARRYLEGASPGRSCPTRRLRRPAGRAALSPPPLLGPRLLRCRGLDSALLVAQHLPAEDAALPVRRATGRSAARHLGRNAHRREIASDARGVGDHREQPHASRAGGTGEDVHAEGARQQLCPRAVAAGRARSVGLGVATAGSSVGGFGAMRGLHGLAAASTPA